MTSKQSVTTILIAGAFLLTSAFAFAQSPATPNGETLFNAKCKSCHDPAVERAPNLAALRTRTQADIVQSLQSGLMAPMATGMTPGEMQAVAGFISKIAAASDALSFFGDPASVGNEKVCASHPPIAAREGDWATLGVSTNSSRFQRHPELSVSDIPKLKLKWAFTMQGGGQPMVVGDWLFMTNRGGKFFALDAKSGCVHWSLSGAGSRTTPSVIRSNVSPSGWATFIGTNGRVIRAIDAQTGKDIWRSEPLEAHPAALLTGTPIAYGDRLFVPMSSLEEVTGAQESYPCCSFRGSLSALDIKTGKVLWKTYTITEPLKPTRKNAKGTQLQGPAGAAIWASPTIDEKRKLIYVVTGDSYTDADTKGADAVMAVEMETGKVRWSHQVTEADNFTLACGAGPMRNSSCPENEGPDVDFGASPILFKLNNGRDVVVAGQKSGVVYGFDTDNGKMIWKTAVGSGSALGGIEWGIGADDRYVFVPNADTVLLIDEILKRRGEPLFMGVDLPAKPGLSALDPATGKVTWHVPAPIAPCKYANPARERARGECVRAQSAAPAVIPGAVFSGTVDGWMRAYDSSTGKIIWAYSTTAQTYDTVNGIKGQPGGGIDGMGPTIAHGMVYFMSGFNGASSTGSNGNNVLLAFSVDGK